MLHNIMKRYRKEFIKTPILRKLLKVNLLKHINVNKSAKCFMLLVILCVELQFCREVAPFSTNIFGLYILYQSTCRRNKCDHYACVHACTLVCSNASLSTCWNKQQYRFMRGRSQIIPKLY